MAEEGGGTGELEENGELAAGSRRETWRLARAGTWPQSREAGRTEAMMVQRAAMVALLGGHGAAAAGDAPDGGSATGGEGDRWRPREGKGRHRAREGRVACLGPTATTKARGGGRERIAGGLGCVSGSPGARGGEMGGARAVFGLSMVGAVAASLGGTGRSSPGAGVLCVCVGGGDWGSD